MTDGKADSDERKGNIGRRDWARQPVDHPATEYREMLFGACNTIDRQLDLVQELKREVANEKERTSMMYGMWQAQNQRADELEREVVRLKETIAGTFEWTKNSDHHPPPHHKYLVRRDRWRFVGTPCYGMHAPWWVPATADTEAEPVTMLDTDEWMQLP